MIEFLAQMPTDAMISLTMAVLGLAVSGTDANRRDDISHNGSSGFGDNADSAETADLVHPRVWPIGALICVGC
jgi:hypothetical protein